MDRWKYWTVTHRDHDLMNPLDPGDLEEIVALADLPRGARVLDIGCGKADLLLLLLARGAGSAVGVEFCPGFAAEARERAAARLPGADLAVVEVDGKDYDGEPGSFDLAACVGASWIFGGRDGTLDALARWTRPGGIVLSGEPFWMRPPTAEYCAEQEVEPGTFGTHAENAAAGCDRGLLLLSTRVSPASGWDRYEGLQWRAAEEWGRAHPDDPDRETILSRARGWRDSFLREGRETLGFALYLFRKPG